MLLVFTQEVGGNADMLYKTLPGLIKALIAGIELYSVFQDNVILLCLFSCHTTQGGQRSG